MTTFTQMIVKRRTRTTADWSITFEDASSLKSVVEASAAVMQRVVFKVVKKNENYTLMVDGADTGYTCCVSARLQLQKVDFADEVNPLLEFTFCVDCKQLLYSIDNPSCAHHSLILEGHSQDASVHIRLFDFEQRSHQDSSRLNTFVDGDPPVALSDIEFKLLLELDVSKLKEMVKKGRKAHAETLKIMILTKMVASKEKSVVIFYVSGDTEHQQIFCHDTYRNEDGSLIVRAAADGEEDIFDMKDDDSVYEGTFPIEKIDSFIKNLPSKVIMAKVMTGMPLLLQHDLGAAETDSSHIRFLIAPVVDDD